MPVELDAELAFPGYARTDRPAIVVRPGLEVPTLNWLVACGIVGNRFGFDVTPDLPTSDGGHGPRRGHLRLIPGGAR